MLVNDLFCRTTWVSQHQKGKPFWILINQEMMGWQKHQLDHMQIICTLLKQKRSISTLACSSQCPSYSVNALKEGILIIIIIIKNVLI